jgi:predicted aspartyl protease
MASVFFPSLADAEVVEVELLKLDGNFRSLRLMVDSGFTGTNSLVLPDSAVDLVRTANGWQFFLSDGRD